MSACLSKVGGTFKETIIGDDVWIGAGAFVRQGVTIGRGAVIGAGAIILRDVAPYAIMVGTPAVQKRLRFSPEQISEIEASSYWLYTPDEARRRAEALGLRYGIRNAPGARPGVHNQGGV